MTQTDGMPGTPEEFGVATRQGELDAPLGRLGDDGSLRKALVRPVLVAVIEQLDQHPLRCHLLKINRWSGHSRRAVRLSAPVDKIGACTTWRCSPAI